MGLAPVLFGAACVLGLVGLFTVLTMSGWIPGALLGGAVLLAFLGVKAA